MNYAASVIKLLEGEWGGRREGGRGGMRGGRGRGRERELQNWN